MRKNIRKAARGFTLIELVIVVAVIAILAALLVPTILGQAEKARQSRARADTTEIAKAAARLRTDTEQTDADCYTYDVLVAQPAAGAGPDVTGAGVDGCDLSTLALCSDPTLPPGLTCFGGPYLANNGNQDPWGTAYTIAYDGTTSAITVTSAGRDRIAGGANAADDLVAIQ